MKAAHNAHVEFRQTVDLAGYNFAKSVWYDSLCEGGVIPSMFELRERDIA